MSDILFGIKITGSDKVESLIKGLSDNLDKLTNQISANRKAMKLLEKDNQTSSDAYKNISLNTKLLVQEKKDLTNTLKQELNVERAVNGSMGQVNAELRKQYSLIKELKQGTQEYTRAAERIKELENKQRDFNEEIGRSRTFVGEYAKGFEQALNAVNQELIEQTALLDRLQQEQKQTSAEYKDTQIRIEKLTQEQKQLNQQIAKGAADFNTHVEDFKEGFAKIGMAIAGVMVVWNGMQRIGEFFSSSIEAYEKQENAVRSLTVALGKESEALQMQSAQLQQNSKFADDEILQGDAYLAMLGMTETQIKQLMPVIVDFAAAKQISVEQAADKVAKAWATESKIMKGTGIALEGAAGSQEKFNSAVDELTKAFGGQAEALKDTDGGLKQFKNNLGDTKELIGGMVVSILGDFIPAINRMLSMFNALAGRFATLKKELNLSSVEASKSASMYESFAIAYEKSGGKIIYSAEQQKEVILAYYKAFGTAVSDDNFELAALTMQKLFKDMKTPSEAVDMLNRGLAKQAETTNLLEKETEKLSDAERAATEAAKERLQILDELNKRATLILSDYNDSRRTEDEKELDDISKKYLEEEEMLQDALDKKAITEADAAKRRFTLQQQYDAEFAGKQKEQAAKAEKEKEDAMFEVREQYGLVKLEEYESRENAVLAKQYLDKLITYENFELAKLALKEKYDELRKAEKKQGLGGLIGKGAAAGTEEGADVLVEAEKLRAEQIADIYKALYSQLGSLYSAFSKGMIDNVKNNADSEKKVIKGKYDSDIAALEQSKQRGLITEMAYNNAKTKLKNKQEADIYKIEREAFYREQKLKIANVFIEGAMEVAKINANPVVTADLTQVLRGILTTAAIIRTGIQAAAIGAQKFALSGLVQQGFELPGFSKSGDNTLALVKPGEVILNEDHQARLGGAATFRNIGVPGFANGGVAPSPVTSTFYAKIDNKELAATINTQRVINVATDTIAMAKRVLNEQTADDI